MRGWGVTLLVGSFASLVCFIMCGEFGGSGRFVNFRFDRFMALEIVIWSALCGICLLRQDVGRFFGFLKAMPATDSDRKLNG